MTILGPGTDYSTKTIKYKDEKATSVTIQLTLFEAEGNSALMDAGWGGTYLMMSNMEGGVNYSTTSVHDFANRIEAREDAYLYSLLHHIESGGVPMTALNDGETYTPDDVKSILAGNGLVLL